MSIEMLTYEALAARLDISPEAARAVARRSGLPRSRSSDGNKTLVAVDVGGLRHRRRTPSGRTVKMEALQAEIVRLASTVGMHRADLERERERADRLEAQVANVTAEIMSIKETMTRLEDELAALRIGVQKQPPSRLGRLTASVVEADRRARR